MSNKAIEIPMNDCGLTINVGLDGVWLHFTASTGQCVSLPLETLMENQRSLQWLPLRDWGNDRVKQARDTATTEKIVLSKTAPSGPYGEWCRNPSACADRGYCPLDPTCGD